MSDDGWTLELDPVDLLPRDEGDDVLGDHEPAELRPKSGDEPFHDERPDGEHDRVLRSCCDRASPGWLRVRR